MSRPAPVITIVGKPGCHLCEDARSAVDAVVAGLGGGIPVRERSILDDPELHERHWDEIPVVLIDGEVHTIWRVDRERLRAALVGDYDQPTHTPQSGSQL